MSEVLRRPQLGIHDAELLADWMLYHLPGELRGQLMADMPTLYARVFPGVDPEAIMARVRDSITRIRREQREQFAAAASLVAAQLEEEP